MAKQTTVNISMPESMAAFVRDRVERGGYGNTSEYFRSLVREDLKRAREEEIERLLAEGYGSGGPREVTDGWWAERRRKLESRGRKRKTA
jgi:antitoxin ParD1/3/4